MRTATVRPIDRPRTRYVTIHDWKLRNALPDGPQPSLPGCFVTPQKVLKVPENAWAVVESMLKIPVTIETKGPPAGWCRNWTDFVNYGGLDDLSDLGKLFLNRTPYQQRCIVWTMNRDGSLVVAPGGAGKTLIALAGATAAHDHRIVFLTSAKARDTIDRECYLFLNRDRATWTVCEGTKPAALPDQRVLIMGYETLHGWYDLLATSMMQTKQKWTVIYDEVHRVKNTKRADAVSITEHEYLEYSNGMRYLDRSKQWVKADSDGFVLFNRAESTASNAAQLARKADRRIAITATPIPDRIRDLWGELDCVEPGCWGPSGGIKQHGWLHRYAGARDGQYGIDTTGRTNQEELKRRMAGMMIEIEEAEVAKDLPEKKRAFIKLRGDSLDKPAGGFVARNRVGKLTPGERIEMELERASTMKRSYIMGLIEDHCIGEGKKHKVLLFTGRRRDADTLGALIQKKWPDLKTWVGHGEHSEEVRKQIEIEYMGDVRYGKTPHPGPCVLVGTYDAWGESLSLHDSDAQIMAMLPYTPRMIRQAENRGWRKGMKRPITIYWVIAEGTYDEHVAAILMDKLPPVSDLTMDKGAGQIAEGMLGDRDEILDGLLEKLGLGLVGGDGVDAEDERKDS